jgi:hypothetical protein
MRRTGDKADDCYGSGDADRMTVRPQRLANRRASWSSMTSLSACSSVAKTMGSASPLCSHAWTRVTAVSSATFRTCVHVAEAASTACAAASGFFGDLLSDRPWDIDLTPFVTQQLQPVQIAEKHERRRIHHPYTHGASSAAALSSASICSSCKLMA